MSKAILVTGATGKQGGSVIKALLSEDSDFQLLAVTRDKSSGSAQTLASKSPKISLVQGNLDDTEALFEEAKKTTALPIWGVFSVQTMTNKGGAEIEEKQGKSLVDSAIKNDVRHFVYSSVDRGGDASTDNKTNVPHFISKYNIEHHLFNATEGSDMTWTILRPVAFMDNFDGGFLGKVFASTWKLVVKSKPLQLVATDDIGVFAAKSFVKPDEYADKCISLAGDELTYKQMTEVFTEKTGAGPPETWGMVARGVLWMSKEMDTMFSFFEKEGYGADIGELRKVHPEMMNLASWLEKEGKQKQGA